MTTRKRDLIIIIDKRDSSSSMNAQLVTSYMNRFIIDEDQQIEVKEIIDFRDRSSHFESHVFSQFSLVNFYSSWEGSQEEWGNKSFWEICLVLDELYEKIKQAFYASIMPFSRSFWSLLYHYLIVIERNLTIQNSYLHFIIGLNSEFDTFPVWFNHLKNSFGIIGSQACPIYFTFLRGERMNIIRKKNIKEDSNQSPSILPNSSLNFDSIWRRFRSIRTFGDDIELLYDQMKKGRIQITKYQPLHGHFLLSENDLEKLKSNDYDYLYQGSQVVKQLLDAPESVFVRCEGTRTTLE